MPLQILLTNNSRFYRRKQYVGIALISVQKCPYFESVNVCVFIFPDKFDIRLGFESSEPHMLSPT